MNVPSLGKCPKCDKILTNIQVGHVEIDVFMGRKWDGIAYYCPFCNTILSCQIDPIAIKTDIINEIVNELKSSEK